MHVTDVRCHVLLDPGFDVTATSSAQDTIVVEVLTDEGITGIGETDLNAWIARACIEAPGTHTMDLGLREMLIGTDPLDPEARWQELYVGSAMSGRRGAVVHALGALDIALWDICGQARGVPCWQLWGEAARESLTPYASLQPEVGSYAEYRESLLDWAARAVALSFPAVKLEATFSGPYRHRGLDAPDEAIAEVVASVREAVGDRAEIMVDVQYAFDSTVRALATAERLAEQRVFFLEAPLWPDDLEGYADLCRRSPVPIAGGEWLSTRHEHADLMMRGGVHVDQPDIGRVGGFTEARRVCDLAGELGRLVVPHAWKTGISVAAAAHLAAVTPHMPFFEFLPAELCESALRQELADTGLRFLNGTLALPDRPGLGVELNRDALAQFAAAARSARGSRA
ncbi:MAG: mandelate racemase/muconate lactonizing enzyme family protein [Solirubrobacteraceae bacterium]